MTISLQFLGAARHVTGSKHLLKIHDQQVLLDCGMVQGPRRIANAANRDLAVDARKVDAVVLSHGHIDHSGSLPRLVKLGFKGPIYCTEATESLLEILLADSAHIQANDARYLKKKKRSFEPPYDINDVKQTLRQVRSVPYYKSVEVLPGVQVKFLDAGHILGSALVCLEMKDKHHHLRLCFTGDHGRKDMPILRDPDKLPDCDVLITESTYGNRLHAATKDIRDSLADIINEEARDGGRILIPAFSVGRTQNVLFYLSQLIEEGRIKPLPIFVDSPLSTKATKAISRHHEVLDAEIQEILNKGGHPFFFDGVRFVADVEESMSLNSLRQGIIISASGMCEAGRILHHMKQSIGRKEDCIVMVGYQASGTLGRKLVRGELQVKIFGEEYVVRCKVRSMDGLSAHADYKELLAHLRHLAPVCRKTFVVHGEDKAAESFADKLRETGFQHVEIPSHGEEFILQH